MVHLSAGDLLRAERDRNPVFAKEFNEHTQKGTIVPVAVTCRLLKNVFCQVSNFLEAIQ